VYERVEGDTNSAPLCSGSKQPYCRFLPEDSLLDLFELGDESEIQGLAIVIPNSQVICVIRAVPDTFVISPYFSVQTFSLDYFAVV
jgi:hypothetical protein